MAERETCDNGHRIEWRPSVTPRALMGDCPCSPWLYVVSEDCTLRIERRGDSDRIRVGGVS